MSAPIEDYRITMLTEKSHRERRLAAALVMEGDMRDNRIRSRVLSHGTRAAEFDRQASVIRAQVKA